MVRPSTELDVIGLYGSLGGPQTVPRAELNALLSFLLFLILTPDPCTVYAYTDNKAVYDGYNQGRGKRKINTATLMICGKKYGKHMT